MKPQALRAGYALVIVAILQSIAAWAQIDQEISDQDLLDPWKRASAVVLSLAQSLDAVAEPVPRAQIEHELDLLDAGLSRLQSQQETVAVRIAADPSFSYDASVQSSEMSTLVAEVAASFDALLSDLSVGDRPDVVATRESIGRLRRILYERNHLERDVVRALGAGGRHEIQALAARWWDAAEAVGSVKDAIAKLRGRLTATPDHGRN